MDSSRRICSIRDILKGRDTRMKTGHEKNLIEIILEKRRRDGRAVESERPVSELEKLARKRKHRSLAAKLEAAKNPCVIAEMKKASPSAGLLCPDYNPGKIARDFAAYGASAISVLTESHYFLGDIDHIKTVREVVNLPILRKDFICDPYQVYESAAMGADVILLIVKALDPVLMGELYRLAQSLGLEVLIESHSEEELKTSIGYRDALLGINNRDLMTLRTDLNRGLMLAELIPPGRLAVIESGIKTREEIEKFWSKGYRGFLIGEVLMKSSRSGLMLAELTGKVPMKTG